MKRRTRKTLNFFAFNLLFFAIYLNFIQKDNSADALQQNAVNNVKANQSVANPSLETKTLATVKGATN